MSITYYIPIFKYSTLILTTIFSHKKVSLKLVARRKSIARGLTFHFYYIVFSIYRVQKFKAKDELI